MVPRLFLFFHDMYLGYGNDLRVSFLFLKGHNTKFSFYHKREDTVPFKAFKVRPINIICAEEHVTLT